MANIPAADGIQIPVFYRPETMGGIFRFTVGNVLEFNVRVSLTSSHGSKRKYVIGV
jgi:hypothetical protein